MVESEGMPVRINRSQNLTYGNLYIKFKVKFPESLDHETCEKLKCLMTASPPIEIDRWVKIGIYCRKFILYLDLLDMEQIGIYII